MSFSLYLSLYLSPCNDKLVNHQSHGEASNGVHALEIAPALEEAGAILLGGRSSSFKGELEGRGGGLLTFHMPNKVAKMPRRPFGGGGGGGEDMYS